MPLECALAATICLACITVVGTPPTTAPSTPVSASPASPLQPDCKTIEPPRGGASEAAQISKNFPRCLRGQHFLRISISCLGTTKVSPSGSSGSLESLGILIISASERGGTSRHNCQQRVKAERRTGTVQGTAVPAARGGRGRCRLN